MGKVVRGYGFVLMLFICMSLLSFRCGLVDGQIFSGSDCNIGLIANAHQLLPDLFDGAYRAGPVFGHAGSVQLSFFNLGRWLLSPEVFSNTWYGVCLVLSSLFLVVYLRLWKLHWLSCIFGALVAFWLGSITLAPAGHLNKFGVMMFFTLALCLLEKGVRSETHHFRVLWALGVGVAVGFMLLEQQDVALLAGLFLGAYALFRICQTHLKKAHVWVELLGPIAVVGLLMAAPSALSAYRQNVTETGLQEDPAIQWEFVTQWSMVPSELPDLIAPGYTGWSTGNPDGPYWGKIGRSEGWEKTKQGFQSFKLDNSYLGIVPVFLAFFGFGAALLSRKKESELSAVIFCWAALALLALLLSFGKFSIWYKIFYHFPLVGNIRAPVKFLHNFQVMNAIIAAYGLDQLIRKEWKWKYLIVGIGVVVGFFFLLAGAVDGSNFSEWGAYASVIVKNTRAAWIHAAVMLCVLGGYVLCRWKKTPLRLQTLALCLLLVVTAIDSLLLTSRYFKSESITQLKAGNPVADYLLKHQGNDRIFFLDQSGVYNKWLAQEGPYYGLNIFNIWQMPRMPLEYKEWLTAASQSQVRLWQLASVKYITAPASVLSQLSGGLKEQLNPVMYYRFVQEGEDVRVDVLSAPSASNDQVLFEFSGALSRFSLLYQWKSIPRTLQCNELFSPAFNPLTTILLDPDCGVSDVIGGMPSESIDGIVSNNRAVIETNAEKAAILLFNQRFQSDWNVTVDGEPANLLRCNYLCMGVYVPAGKHKVEFTLK